MIILIKMKRHLVSNLKMHQVVDGLHIGMSVIKSGESAFIEIPISSSIRFKRPIRPGTRAIQTLFMMSV